MRVDVFFSTHTDFFLGMTYTCMYKAIYGHLNKEIIISNKEEQVTSSIAELHTIRK